MPMIELTAPHGVLSPDRAAALLDELSTTLLHWEKAPDTDFFREITWAHLYEIAPSRVNGRPQNRFRVDVTVPAGAFSQRRKDGLIGEVHAAVAAAVGIADADALHVWTLIHEIPEGNWGGGGNTVRYAQLLDLAAAERTARGSAAVSTGVHA